MDDSFNFAQLLKGSEKNRDRLPKKAEETHRPMIDFIKAVPPTLTAETMIVIIPSGAIPSKKVSAVPNDVARNCLVTSSPNRVRKGTKSATETKASFAALLIAVLFEVVILVADGLVPKVGHDTCEEWVLRYYTLVC